MVKVEGLTEREKAFREKKSKLMKATEEALGAVGKERIVHSDPWYSSFNLKHHSTSALGSSISVAVDTNTISVYHPAYLEEARAFAELYETVTKEEFMVKILYG